MTDVFSLRVCGDNHYPPFEFLNDEGVFKGFNVDVLEAIGNELGIKVEFEPMPWAKAVCALQEGRYDAVQGMVMSPKRLDVFAFSEEYLVVSHAIFVLKKRYDIMGINDLKGLKVAIQRADVSYELINSHVGDNNSFLHFIFTNNQVEAFEKLIEGKVDAYVGNRLTGAYLAQKLGQVDKVRVAGEPISPTAYCIAVLREKQQLLELLNRGIRTIKNNVVYDSICEKWFGTVINNLDSHIVESVDVGVVAINHLGVVVSMNSYARRILGLKAQCCLGRHFLETPLAYYFDPARIHKAMTTGKGFFDQEVLTNGEIEAKAFTYNVCPLFEEGTKPIGCIVSFRDVSLEKQMKESLIRKDKMESLGLLLANLVHEIRNPIASIKTFVEALPRYYDDPKFRDEMLKHVPAEIDRLTRLVDDVLEYSRPRSAVRRKCYLYRVLNDVLTLVRRGAGEGLKFKLHIPEDIWVWADESQLKQVFINVLMNAVEALAGKAGLVKITATRRKNRVMVEVRDNGPGISPEHLSRVFDPFFTAKENGTGLGLFVTYQLVKENSGDISISSRVGEGTTVRIEFPREDYHGKSADNR